MLFLFTSVSPILSFLQRLWKSGACYSRAIAISTILHWKSHQCPILYDFSGHKPDLEGKIQIFFRYGFPRPVLGNCNFNHVALEEPPAVSVCHSSFLSACFSDFRYILESGLDMTCQCLFETAISLTDLRHTNWKHCQKENSQNIFKISQIQFSMVQKNLDSTLFSFKFHLLQNCPLFLPFWTSIELQLKKSTIQTRFPIPSC